MVGRPARPGRDNDVYDCIGERPTLEGLWPHLRDALDEPAGTPPGRATLVANRGSRRSCQRARRHVWCRACQAQGGEGVAAIGGHSTRSGVSGSRAEASSGQRAQQSAKEGAGRPRRKCHPLASTATLRCIDERRFQDLHPALPQDQARAGESTSFESCAQIRRQRHHWRAPFGMPTTWSLVAIAAAFHDSMCRHGSS